MQSDRGGVRTSMKCALCNRERPLIKAHIFPEFLYRPLYDDKHFFNVVRFGSQSRLGRRPKGVYDNSLLCADCDNVRLNEYEDYACSVFTDRNSVRITDQKYAFLVEGLDYRRFKLFLLSLIWRAGVSERTEFANVELGPHAEQMRQMLYVGDPGSPDRYGCLANQIAVPNLDAVRMIEIPESIHIGSHRCYRTAFMSIFWFVLVSGHSATFPFQEILLSDRGSIMLLKSHRGINDYFMRMSKDAPTR
jgi:hypothetical protein